MSATPWARITDEDRIQALYEDGLARFGGSAGPAKDGCVSGTLGAAWSAEMYADDDEVGEGAGVPGLLFAAYLLVGLATKHCYVDGNKRVAWLSMVDVLFRHGLTVRATEDEAYNFVIDIVEGRMRSAVKVALWLVDRLEAIPYAKR